MMGNDADGQDALQDALISLARGVRRFDGRSTFSTWSYRVATNACLDELRRRKRRPVPGSLGAGALDDGDHGDGSYGGVDLLERAAAEPGPGLPGSILGGGSSATVDGGISAVADRLDVDAAVGQLRADFRAAVVLRDLCDLDYGEIARVLDIPPGTVRSRIARGRAQLADILGNPAASPDRPTTSP
jgi:RNA polymerase sigma-70 factor (ECF subfamily)